MDVYVTLRFHHGGKLQQKPRIKYEGGIVTDCFDVDVDKLSYFEFVDIVKEIGYNCSACVVYIKPPKCRRVVEVKSDRDIMGIRLHNLKNLLWVKGEELGEVFGRTSASVGEDLGKASASVGEDLGRDSVSVGEDLGGTSSSAAASDIPEVGSDWESETEASDDSDNADLSDEGEDEYGSDVHEEGPRFEGVDLGKKGVDLGYDQYLSKKQTTFEGKIAGDEPYFDSDEAVSFEIDTDEDVNEEDEVEQPIRRQRKARRAKRNKKKVVFDPTCQLIVWETGLAFESVK
ncbi:hypothetical protein KY290_021765 [Solanum tuberosum]|uniref:PB1-like domain-containing protein n=1 Tax=Solanum tuberosum TaxID=4113 RepID=A0ABQ7V4J5_SOLTU|nr:hypothetical protein KY289_020928 [Solanum tuberosum]KAH0758272.1 hypothetical protein KY290_021765 [Solanum tuberosum]